MLGEACPFWLGQLQSISLIKVILFFFYFREFTDILIKANLFRKVRALSFQNYFKI